MRPLPDRPIFTRGELRALHWSDGSISRAVRSQRLVQVRRGVFASTGEPTARVRAIAASRAIAGSVLSHRSALLLHDLPVVGALPPSPEITVAPGGRGSAHDALLHRAQLPAAHLVLIDGRVVTSAARTVIDVARSRPTTTAVAAMDAALNHGLASLDDLDDVLVHCWNWPGIRRAHRALRLCDGRSESALESVSRLVIGWLGLPPPELQPRVIDEYGHAVARLDFYWDQVGVAGEADGRGKYDARAILTAEKERQEQAEDLAVVFARWGWAETRHPFLLRRKVETAFERGAARDRSGHPRLWSISRSKPVRRKEDVIEWSDARKT